VHGTTNPDHKGRASRLNENENFARNNSRATHKYKYDESLQSILKQIVLER
jgi:hypothetical protein